MILFFIISIIWSYNLNNKIDWNYELVDLDTNKYNFNLLNNLNEKELLNAWIKLSFSLWITNEQLNKFIPWLLNYENNIKINLPSQIPNALINKKEQKYVLYSPQNYNKDKIIFVLHWSCWGFLFYQKYFKQFADKYNYQVVTPTFWWWNWNENWWIDLIYNTYNDLLNKQKINKNTQIILIWISNWWVWISRSIYFDDKNIFQKIIYISGVMEENIINTPNFEKNIKNKYVYVISWEKDDRVFYDNYLKQKDKLNVKKDLVFADWDHFILLSKWQKIIDFIDKIIKQ